MSKIAIVTDSTAYLTEEEIKEYGITVVPLTVNFEDGFIYDSTDEPRAFFERVDKATKIPFTSQPAVGQFVEAYEKLLKDGKEIISIHISSKLSGTVESAGNAARMLDAGKITIVDSLQTGAPLTMMVLETVKLVKEGLNRSEIETRLQEAVGRFKTYFIPSTLEYLKKGGRIGGAQALLGTLLQIKPVLHLHEGRVEALDKVRTWKKAVERVLKEMPVDQGPLKVAVIHCLALEEAQEVKEEILRRAPDAEVMIRELGPVISIHTGPGVVGVGYWPQG